MTYHVGPPFPPLPHTSREHDVTAYHAALSLRDQLVLRRPWAECLLAKSALQEALFELSGLNHFRRDCSRWLAKLSLPEPPAPEPPSPGFDEELERAIADGEAE